MELAQLGTGFRAEFVGDGAARLRVCVERLGGPAGSIQGLHQQQPQPLPERMAGQQPPQLRYDLGVAAAGDLRPDPELGRVEAEPGQPFGLRLDQRGQRNVSQRDSAPER